jgi:hypothetical protein
MYNKKAPISRYLSFWEVDSVIEFLISLGPNSDLTFKNLSMKLAMLLALSSLCRVSELANIIYSMFDCITPISQLSNKPIKRTCNTYSVL